MKKCYADLERLPENVIKKCFGKVDLKNEIKIEEHDDLSDQIYSDDVCQFVFLLFDTLKPGKSELFFDGILFSISLIKINFLK